MTWERLSDVLLRYLDDGKYRGAGWFGFDVPYDEVRETLETLVEEGKLDRHPSRELYRKAGTQ